MYCKKCGAELMEGTSFCHKCGCKVSLPVDDNISVSMEEEASTSRLVMRLSQKRTIALVIAVVILVLAGAGTVAAKTLVDSPEKTVRKMIEAFSNADIASMLQCYSPKTNAQYEGAMGLMGMFGIDGNAIVGIASSYADTPKLKVKVKEVEYYKSGKKISSNMPQIITNSSADKALIMVELYENGDLWDTRTFELSNYEKDGWLIEEDLFGM